MGKQLVNRQNVESYICQTEKQIIVDPSMILAPSAKDYLQEKGIAIRYAQKPSAPAASACGKGPADTRTLRETISAVLQRDFGICDPAQTAEIIEKVLQKIAASH